MSSPLDDSLRYEKSQIEDELKTLRKEIQECEAKCRKLETRLHHVDGLLGIGQDSPDTVPAKNGHPVLDLAVEILKEPNKEPMQYRELHDAVVEMGGESLEKTQPIHCYPGLVRMTAFVDPIKKVFML